MDGTVIVTSRVSPAMSCTRDMRRVAVCQGACLVGGDASGMPVLAEYSGFRLRQAFGRFGISASTGALRVRVWVCRFSSP